MNAADVTRLSALIIDDAPFMRDLLQATLEHLGVVDTAVARDGTAALERLEGDSRGFDLILCDLHMPRMDGIELLRHLAARRFSGGIVLLSGKDHKILRSAVNVARDRHLNVLGSLAKPVAAEALGGLIKGLSGEQPKAQHGSSVPALTEAEIRDGLESDRLVLFYQPQVDMRTRHVIGMEALARWQHPMHGVLTPDTFVPVIEHCTLVHGFTEATLRAAVRQQRRWRDQGLHLQLAVNVSVAALERLDLPELIEALCIAAQVDPATLVLEITETQFATDSATVLDVLTRLKLKGLNLSLDDFGTGYSTLEQLKRAPFDEIKADRSFVHGAKGDPLAEAILESSVALGQQLGLTIVAEGVEDVRDWAVARRLGCNICQGFLIGRPLPPQDLDGWLGGWVKARHGPAQPRTGALRSGAR